jgi:hypothetical protein
MSLYDPVGSPRSVRGTPSRIQRAFVAVVKSDGTIDARMIGRTLTKSTLEVPAWYKPAKGDQILVADIDGDQNRPIVLQAVSGAGVTSSSAHTQNVFIGHTAPSVPAGTGLYLWFETNVAETEVLEVRLGKA